MKYRVLNDLLGSHGLGTICAGEGFIEALVDLALEDEVDVLLKSRARSRREEFESDVVEEGPGLVGGAEELNEHPKGFVENVVAVLGGARVAERPNQASSCLGAQLWR